MYSVPVLASGTILPPQQGQVSSEIFSLQRGHLAAVVSALFGFLPNWTKIHVENQSARAATAITNKYPSRGRIAVATIMMTKA
jgi:hypothetical protein